MNRDLISRALRLIATATLSLGVVACGGGGDGEPRPQPNVPPPPPPPPPEISGKFKDFSVSGLSYLSGQQSGITDPAGTYRCETGNSVEFSVGAVSLGSTACATFVAPNQLATPGTTFDLEVGNVARFLQMLDRDGDPDNGIEISPMVQQAAANWSQVDFLSMDLETELMTIRSDAASVDGTPHPLPSATDALTHLVETLVCQYSGAYSGSISGSATGAAGMVIGWSRFGFVPLNFEWQGIDPVQEFSVFGGGGGSITVLDLPVIDHTDPSVAGPISAMFVDPDNLTGTWDGGAVELTRIGGDNGAPYRLVGKADSAEVAAYISLNLDTSALSGQAFDVVGGTLFQVNGTLAGDTVALTATGGGESLTGTGTLTRDAAGAPAGVQGQLDDGSTFDLVACRLN